MTELGRAVRGLLRTPGPTVAAVAALALGIGSATALFSVADAVVLKPLPYAAADRLVSLEGNFLSLGMRDIGASAPELLDYRARARSLDGIVAFSRIEANLTGGGDPERLPAARVSPGLLALLGVTPALGRAFAPGEGLPGGDAVVILSWGLWQRRFAGDGAVIGRSIVSTAGPAPWWA
ncbi:MAG TPA: ABC transporter permease [Vicinamibacteria bacterium]